MQSSKVPVFALASYAAARRVQGCFLSEPLDSVFLKLCAVLFLLREYDQNRKVCQGCIGTSIERLSGW